MESGREYIEKWRPQPGPQEALLECPVGDIFYGGARGGGKSDGCLGEWLRHAARYGERAHGVFFRRRLHELDPIIKRSHELFREGARYSVQRKRWGFANGAQLSFRHLDSLEDAALYLGQSYTRLYFEELADFPHPEPKFRLMGTLRSAHGVPVRCISTGNPGGPGQYWVKAVYVDPAPKGYTLINHGYEGVMPWPRVFIPARVTDNRVLLEADPGYVDRLRAVGSEALVRAWLDGDWAAVEGAFFSDWDLGKHVFEDQPLPAHWMRFRALDWGSQAPFCVLWVAVSDGELPQFPRDALVVYREWYERGARLTAEQFARGIVERTAVRQAYTEADPSIFSEDGGPSIAERMADEGVICTPADNTRIAGWDQIRGRLAGLDRPMLYVAHSCAHLIREISTAQHDDRNIEDVDTEGDDHAIDALRYGCQSRPWTSGRPAMKPSGLTFQDVMKRQSGRRKVANV